MRLAVFMDPISTIQAYKDSSVAMLKSAEQQGLECYFFTPHDLYARDGEPFANTKSIKILDENTQNWAEVADVGPKKLNYFDIILVRLDPPFDMQYIYALQLLALAEEAGVLVANKPSSLCNLGEKTYTLNFPECAPPTIVTSNLKELKSFWEEYRDVIYKPLDSMGGRGIFHVDSSGQNLSGVLEVLTLEGQKMIMAQRYIPEIITHGDKRVLLINGEPIPYALARIPAAGDFRGNLHAGGTGIVTPLTANENKICASISKSLQNLGLYFVGIDIIGGYLTEINITSPTCIKEINQETGLDIAGDYIKFLVTQSF